MSKTESIQSGTTFPSMYLPLAILRWSRTLWSESPANLGRRTVPTAWEREHARALKERHLAERDAETSRLNKLIEQKLADLDKILSVGIRAILYSITTPGSSRSRYSMLGNSIFLIQSRLWKNSSLLNLARLRGWSQGGEVATRRNEYRVKKNSTPPMRSGNILRKSAKDR